MTLLGEADPAGESRSEPLTLHYATPEPAPRRWGASVSVMVNCLFVCVASIAIFSIVANQGRDVWAAAVAVVALSAMGAFCTFFLTRRG